MAVSAERQGHFALTRTHNVIMGRLEVPDYADSAIFSKPISWSQTFY